MAAAVSMYPEMVDTQFAAPYVRGNPYPTLRTPDEVAERMLTLVSGMDAGDSGRFINIVSGFAASQRPSTHFFDSQCVCLSMAVVRGGHSVVEGR
eukprot:COSAG01_NODE_1132_length_11565_cov_84.210412_5_plen_95_part_00